MAQLKVSEHPAKGLWSVMIYENDAWQPYAPCFTGITKAHAEAVLLEIA